MKPAIRVENLGKRYRVNHAAPREKYRTLRDSLANAAAAPLRRFRNGASDGSTEDFWALRDVDFDVQPGEVVGIIGRNGAGKSTLLKILSRITEPTTGEIRLNGRIASLLEVGTGFHPELTGRENIYLNGSILGMSRREIERRFDEIVAFSGVERFLDTPVKRYSSGMYVRLAFAVAAHLDSESLIIDEVLAVGDSEFQKKCLRKMSDAAHSGRTVLFVSHNMAAVRKLCNTAVLLSHGRVALVDNCATVVDEYLKLNDAPSHERGTLAASREQGMLPILRRIELLSQRGEKASRIFCGESLRLSIEYESPVPLIHPRFGVVIETAFGEKVCFLQTLFQHGTIEELPPSGTVSCDVPSVPLRPGVYYLSVGCSLPDKQLDFLERVASFEVEGTDYFGTGRLPEGHDKGHVLIHANWTLPC